MEKSRLEKVYQDKVVKQLKEKFAYKNVNLVPKLQKIVINCVTREAVKNGKIVDSIVEELSSISGQKPVVVRAKKSIASFKLREGQAMGAMVTLRGRRMYEFMDRLVNFVFPRVRDFKGIARNGGFDGRGNFTLGMKEQISFPEINYDKIDSMRGLGISFTTSASSNEEGLALLEYLGMPFQGTDVKPEKREKKKKTMNFARNEKAEKTE
jgi:large subunit ribosomal protein L5